MMEPLLPAGINMTAEREPEDSDAKRKIQFSVPSAVPLQLDPRQVELIRRRRPTPATLFQLTDPLSPEDDPGSHQVRRLGSFCCVLPAVSPVPFSPCLLQCLGGENGVLKSKTSDKTPSTYEPPSLKAMQRLALAHLSSTSSVDRDDTPSGDENDGGTLSDSDASVQNKARRDRSPSPDASRAAEEADE
ncbi:protein phosphatase 1 regulatory subunit 1B isoform X1 [Syngnathus scovelli]|uniref:protein phosphatase 1 regulatory subunit 1B isoform X1 n=1 Tax=Syngnathus scovelli TaxID=161590 RepID=UPI0021105D45|nr:protein phosphatase 1 regulatory subunit 1B isoform X1 [Syngnathus scovelli]XP_049614881.1 protein phosphatase 1 regulatory subunit 1B isoform X1 [Syngnathus scovelli]